MREPSRTQPVSGDSPRAFPLTKQVRSERRNDMKKVMAWLAALCLLALSVAGALTTAAAGNTAGTAVSGLVHDADGRVRYYENGVPVAKGLVRDDEGNVYYIWNAVNGAARGMFSIPEDKLNGIMPQGFYEFGADYRMIVKNGIYLSGGGALLRGLDKRLTEKINIPFHIAEDPLHSVAKGAGVALKNIERFSFLMR